MPEPRRLVIVESPTKATKIQSYLGNGYVVESSRGHVRDLPQNASEVPAKYKTEPWSRLGVNVEKNFSPLYIVSPDKRDTIRKLKSLLKEADELYLATDEDREGEAIAWHLLQELKPKIPVKRMVFHEITPDAIRAAVNNPRALDEDLVDAQETRRILDRLYGYEVSPVLWKKVMPKLSAGRVQSVATRLIVDRERERMAFTSASYWDLDVTLDAGQQADPRQFSSRLTNLDGQKIARGTDFDSGGTLISDALVLDEQFATQIAQGLTKAAIKVEAVEAKPYSRKPAAPFRTTTLQQEAGRRLHFSTDRTMRVAQHLYESGFITYMRTDSIALSSEAISASRNQIKQMFGEEFLPTKPRLYASKVKNAQEAHEAIRPAGDNFKRPSETGLTGDEFRLYELIWQRTVASQTADALGQSLTVKINAEFVDPIQNKTNAGLSATGRTITFPGFLKVYQDIEQEESAKIPAVVQGQSLQLVEALPASHETKPPARYSEPSLIAKLEELEIGRPSTYASIIRTITARDYVFRKATALVPTWLAFAVTRLMEQHFPQLVDYAFTADLEGALDEIANGNRRSLQVLNDFYSGANGNDGLHKLTTDLGDIDARAANTFPIGPSDSGIAVRIGRYGPYLEDAEQRRANVPNDLAPDELTFEKAKELIDGQSSLGRELGQDPNTHTVIVVKNGRYGPYVTENLPENDELAKSKQPKARTASLFKTMNPNEITLAQALQLLDLPRTLGVDSNGNEIFALNGPYGPYIKKGSDTRQLASEDEIFTVTLEEAEKLFAQPKTRRRAASAVLAELGEDPSTKKKVQIKNGRFGPYVTDGETNQSLPKTMAPDELTIEMASEMLAAKRAKGPSVKKTTKKTSTKKASAKKTSTKTSAGKKTTTKNSTG